MKIVLVLVLPLLITFPTAYIKGQPTPIRDGAGIPPATRQTTDRKPGQNLPPGMKAAQSGDVGREIAELNRRWADAIVRRDAAAQERILADDYTATGVSGVVATKAQIMVSLRTRAGPGADVLEAIEVEESAVRTYGDVALFSGRVRFRGRGQGQPFSDSVQMTIVYVRREGRWQPVASQGTRIAPAGTTPEQ
jgi:ketosteroid isomerase-like protein